MTPTCQKKRNTLLTVLHLNVMMRLLNEKKNTLVYLVSAFFTFIEKCSNPKLEQTITASPYIFDQFQQHVTCVLSIFL